jgi:threonine/homoserine/homoserine lactone efflux protein
VVPQTFAVVFTVMKVFGVAYLLFLAWKMWRAPTEVGSDGVRSAKSLGRCFSLAWQ